MKLIKLCFEIFCLIILGIGAIITIIPICAAIVTVAARGYGDSMIAGYFEFWDDAFERYTQE
jgi:uncharacterized membrane protein